jgi:hypothetical protein
MKVQSLELKGEARSLAEILEQIPAAAENKHIFHPPGT